MSTKSFKGKNSWVHDFAESPNFHRKGHLVAMDDYDEHARRQSRCQVAQSIEPDTPLRGGPLDRRMPRKTPLGSGDGGWGRDKMCILLIFALFCLQCGNVALGFG